MLFRRLFLSGVFSILGIVTLQLNAVTQRDFQSWTNATLTGYFNKNSQDFKRFKYWLENQERIGDVSNRVSQTLLRNALGYAIRANLSVWLGYAWIDTGIPFTKQPFKEDRIWQQLLWTPKYQEWNVSHRLRFEQRFLENNHNVAYRVRYFFKVTKPIKKGSKWMIVSFNEIFWHKNNFIGKNGKGFDQNRFFLGVGYPLYPHVMFEIGYMNQYIHRINVPNFQNDIAALNVLVSL